MTFADLGLIDPLLRSLRAEGYSVPTPVQSQAIPHVLAGRDLLGVAQTGTGKTAAFVLPLLQGLVAAPRPAVSGAPRLLVLAPTRELAAQIHESFRTYGRFLSFRSAVIFGGVGQGSQVNALVGGVHVLVATPGRLLDLMEQGFVRLGKVEFFVLDEADRMLDMGFLRDVRKIVGKLPVARQSLFFSATMPPAVAALAHSLLRGPVRVEVASQSMMVERVAQEVFFVDADEKDGLLLSLLAERGMDCVLVFVRTKHRANKVASLLLKGGVAAVAIHGNKSQTHRTRALADFKRGAVRVLVATDIAARGIDVDAISHVVNYDLPNEPESYVHRVGRTARAGAAGSAYSFCSAEERGYLVDIERLIRVPVAVRKHASHSEGAMNAVGERSRSAAKQAVRGGHRGASRGRGSGRKAGGQAGKKVSRR